MYYREHGVPHFHAEYQGERASFDLEGELMAGWIRSRATRQLVKNWALARHGELLANWHRAKSGELLEPIEPID